MSEATTAMPPSTSNTSRTPGTCPRRRVVETPNPTLESRRPRDRRKHHPRKAEVHPELGLPHDFVRKVQPIGGLPDEPEILVSLQRRVF